MNFKCLSGFCRRYTCFKYWPGTEIAEARKLFFLKKIHLNAHDFEELHKLSGEQIEPLHLKLLLAPENKVDENCNVSAG